MIAIVDTGTGNLRSVAKALAAAGAVAEVTSDPAVVRRADRVVLPGQGAFGGCMRGLAAGLGDAVREHLARQRPYLGICLGLQVLFGRSDEDGDCPGLGLLAGAVERLAPPAGVKVPHMGWNQVRRGPAAGPPVDGEHFYFVHSYRACPTDPSIVALETDYGGQTICAAVARGTLFAVQFHPEKSQHAGLTLLRWFLRA